MLIFVFAWWETNRGPLKSKKSTGGANFGEALWFWCGSKNESPKKWLALANALVVELWYLTSDQVDWPKSVTKLAIEH